ncbi:unnamed protein product [Acanthoscelides obtectus]|uniref:Rab-like protein 3 n=1 Tax=Acanthoscelides obtectus TaxID=200917 RepID=A0A9P0PNE3_ACAOB|nr:unnamed protein product [Acanthoscelides obtectus]CAK1630830.1 Rab-like protein 3 [Acanthoscelides obtectus]
MSVIERVKILVLGDTGVGKTSFVNLAAHNEPLRSPSWTVGCSVEVKLHDYKAGTKDQKTYFVEFWDIGGSQIHRNARSVFYYPCHGAILVHDLTNSKSEKNLNKWVREIVTKRERKYSDYEAPDMSNPVSPNTSIYIDKIIDQESMIGNSNLPFLVIGTKVDQMEAKKTLSSFIANHLGVDEIVLDCRQSRYLAAGTSNAVKLSRFYDKVIETKLRIGKDSFSERLGTVTIPSAISPKFYSPHAE